MMALQQRPDDGDVEISVRVVVVANAIQQYDEKRAAVKARGYRGRFEPLQRSLNLHIPAKKKKINK
jgi:hypothetical protein